MEQPATMYPLCTLIKSDGTPCGSPALKGLNLCFQHIGGSIRSLTRPKPQASFANTRLKFVYPGNREAIQHNLFLVAQALSDGRIDTVMANTYNRLFRTCEVNLRRWETAKQSGAADRMLPLSEGQETDAPTSPVGENAVSDQLSPRNDEESMDNDQEDSAVSDDCALADNRDPEAGDQRLPTSRQENAQGRAAREAENDFADVAAFRAEMDRQNAERAEAIKRLNSTQPPDHLFSGPPPAS